MIPHLEMKHNLNRIMQMGLIMLWCFWGCDIWAASQDDKREKEFKQIAELLQIAVGDTVADVGAGSGLWSFMIVERVGEEGHVFSTEVKESHIKSIRKKAQSRGVKNVTAILGTEDQMGLPEGRCDALLLRLVYHAFNKPEPMRAGLRDAMKLGGLVLIIDFRPEPKQLVEEMQAVGFDKVRVIKKWQGNEDLYAILFQKMK